MIDRVIWIVLDSVGMGEMPDAEKFGDVGSNTIGNTCSLFNGEFVYVYHPTYTTLLEGVQYFESNGKVFGSNIPKHLIKELNKLQESSNKDVLETGEHWNDRNVVLD